MYKQYKPYQIFLILTDMLLTAAVLRLMVELRPVLPGKPVGPEEVLIVPWVYPAVAVLWHTLFALSGVYELSRLPFLCVSS